MFQCGKCKKQFTLLSSFVEHKQRRCSSLMVNLPVEPPDPPLSGEAGHNEGVVSEESSLTDVVQQSNLVDDLQESSSDGEMHMSL